MGAHSEGTRAGIAGQQPGSGNKPSEQSGGFVLGKSGNVEKVLLDTLDERRHT
jgi:hypothetical protein